MTEATLTQTNNQPATKAVDPAAAKRQWTRLSADPTHDETTLFLADGVEVLGIILDSSFGGIGVTVLSAKGIEAGQELRAEYHGAPMRAVVRCVKQQREGTFFVGLEWISRKK
ncbi:MAG: hypothetical protein KDA42_03980 [Planctomycetales bacterium]|nr:hypothetical protein [Planctomycetales bacterium]